MRKRKKNKFFNKRTERIAVITACFLVFLLMIAIWIVKHSEKPEPPSPEQESGTEQPVPESPVSSVTEPAPPADVVTTEYVYVDPSWEYAANSAISSGAAVLYHSRPVLSKGITVCVNAGHGTQGGTSVKTLCHPDGTPKVTGGTTSEGSTTAVAVSTGTELLDGTSEAEANLEAAKVLRDRLLDRKSVV